jgi:ATP synthase F1 gamma subunit
MDIERVQNRLSNVQSVEPLLGALRTISLGAWQIALRHLSNLEIVGKDYQYVLAALSPYLVEYLPKKITPTPNAMPRKTVIVAAGSERGLCGRVDQDLIDFMQAGLADMQDEIAQLIIFGGRLGKNVAQQIMQPTNIHAASSTSMPSYEAMLKLAKEWLVEISAGNIDRVLVFYTAYHSLSSRSPTLMQILPYEIDLYDTETQMDWPPPIIETDPAHLFLRTYEHIVAMRLYEALLHSKASIHSNRYQLMEESTKNADRILEELEILLQMERRQSITREMQELAIGAGLLET